MNEIVRFLLGGTVIDLTTGERRPASEVFKPLDEKVIRYNGGQRCDMEIGPCACGAWHRSEGAAQ